MPVSMLDVGMLLPRVSPDTIVEDISQHSRL